MGTLREVDPSLIRFTQDSIRSCFKFPYEHISIREAVRRITDGRMKANEFPVIQVILHKKIMWSIDNRRLWVFRYSRCKSIKIHILETWHPRFYDVLAKQEIYDLFKAENFFPRVRGPRDHTFDILFPLPVSRSVTGREFCPKSDAVKAATDHDEQQDKDVGYACRQIAKVEIRIQQLEGEYVKNNGELQQKDGKNAEDFERQRQDGENAEDVKTVQQNGKDAYFKEDVKTRQQESEACCSMWNDLKTALAMLIRCLGV